MIQQMYSPERRNELIEEALASDPDSLCKVMAAPVKRTLAESIARHILKTETPPLTKLQQRNITDDFEVISPYSNGSIPEVVKRRNVRYFEMMADARVKSFDLRLNGYEEINKLTVEIGDSLLAQENFNATYLAAEAGRKGNGEHKENHLDRFISRATRTLDNRGEKPSKLILGEHVFHSETACHGIDPDAELESRVGELDGIEVFATKELRPNEAILMADDVGAFTIWQEVVIELVPLPFERKISFLCEQIVELYVKKTTGIVTGVIG